MNKKYLCEGITKYDWEEAAQQTVDYYKAKYGDKKPSKFKLFKLLLRTFVQLIYNKNKAKKEEAEFELRKRDAIHWIKDFNRERGH